MVIATGIRISRRTRNAFVGGVAPAPAANTKTLTPAPGVGKTFVTLNLAAVLAQAGQRVLVIDGDIRRGYLHTALGVSNKYGLSDFLASVDKSPDGGPIDKNNLSTVIQKTKVPDM